MPGGKIMHHYNQLLVLWLNMLNSMLKQDGSLKKFAVHCLEQWPNLMEYFHKFIPKQKNFKREVGSTARYKGIKVCVLY